MSTRPVTRRRPSLLRHRLARLRRLSWVAPALALALFLAAIPGQAGPSGSITASHAAPRSAAPAAATAAAGAAAAPPSSPVVSSGAVGALTAAQSSGTAVTSVPLVSPAFHGISPDLALSYNSAAGNGWIGVGWGLAGLQTITRLSAGRGLASYAADDRFALDGRDLIACHQVTDTHLSPGCRVGAAAAGSPGCPDTPGDTYAYYTTSDERDELICRADSSTDPAAGSWVVTSPDGVRTTLGATEATSRGPVRYATTDVRDLSGNDVAYTWAGAAGQSPALHEIDYNDVRITFAQETRPDPVSVAIPGGTLTVPDRLAAVTVAVSDTVARVYHLSYQVSADTRRSVLAAVQQYGEGAVVAGDGTAAVTVTGPTLPAQTFTTASSAPTSRWPAAGTGNSNNSAADNAPSPASTSVNAASTHDYTDSYRLGTFGDTGRTGLVIWDESPCPTVHGGDFQVIEYPTTDAAGVRSYLSRPELDGSPACVEPSNFGVHGPESWWVADLNGDHLGDLVVLVYDTSSSSTPALALAVYYNLGNGQFNPVPSIAPTEGLALGQCAVGDMTGTGRASVACKSAPGNAPPVYPTPSTGITVVSATPAGVLSARTSAVPVNIDSGPLNVADVNGDGLGDIIVALQKVAADGSVEYTGLQVYLTAAEDGHVILGGPQVTAFPAGPWEDTATDLQLGDVNGDGRTDVVIATHDAGHNYLNTAIAADPGLWDRTTQQVPSWIPQASAESPELSDISGNGEAGITLLMPRGAHASATRCAPAINYPHLEVIRAASNATGSFAWPTGQDDCGGTQELTADLSVDFLTAIGDWLAEVDYRDNTYSGAVDDANGDGWADTIIVLLHSPSKPPDIVVGYASHAGAPATGWIPTSVDDSGGTAFVAVTQAGGQLTVHTLRPRTTPLSPNCFKDHNSPMCGSWVTVTQTVSAPASPDPGGTGMQPVATYAAGWHTLDIAGNGRDALVYVGDSLTAPPSGGGQPQPAVLIAVYPATSAGYAASPVVTWLPRAADSVFASWQAAGLGDGRQGLLSVEDSLSAGTLTTHAVTIAASGTATDATTVLPRPAWTDLAWRAVDTNADGRADLVQVHQDGVRLDVDTLVATPAGFTQTTGTYTGSVRSGDNQAAWVTGDFNGDGITDLADVVQENSVKTVFVDVLLGVGDGTWRVLTPNGVTAPITVSNAAYGRWQAVDVNGDGRDDLVALGADFIGTGTSQTDARTLLSRGTSFASGTVEALNIAAPGAYRWLWDDGNGDRLPDLVNVAPAANGWQVDQRLTQAGSDLLTGVADSIGATARVSYAATGQYRQPGSSTCTALPAGVGGTLVSGITVDGGGSSVTTTSYGYDCGTWSPQLHHVLGWAKTSAATSASAHRAAVTTAVTSRLSDACGAQPTISSATSGSTVLASTVTAFPAAAGPGQPSRCEPTQVRATACGDTGCGATPAVNETDLAYDDNGNTTEITETQRRGGDVLAERATTASYTALTSPYLPGLVTSMQVRDGSPTAPVVSETSFCYDGTCAGTAADPRGLLTAATVTDPTGRAAPRITSYAYDQAGNLTSTTDPDGNTTTATWDPATDTLPVTVTDALGERTTTSWDPVLGQPATVTSPDGLTTSYTYDSFGRPTAVTSPGGSRTTTQYLNFGDPASQAIRTSTDNGSADGIWQATAFDGLGRVTTLTRESADGDPDETVTGYDDASTLPVTQTHWTTASSAATAPTETYDYDPLGRLIRQTHPDHSFTAAAYTASDTGTVVTATDETGDQVARDYDGWGRETSVTQPTADGTAAVTSRYDVLNNLTSTTDPSGVTTTDTYDGDGDLAAQDSPDSGRTTATYDGGGNPTSTTDARGDTVKVTYDALSRPVTSTTLDHSGHTASRITLAYSQAGHGAATGQLTSVTDTASAAGCPSDLADSLSYDAAGRPASQTTCVAGRSETFAVGYDQWGRVASLTYPGGEQLPLTYNSAGQLTGEGSYATGATYDPSGQLTSLTLGNGSTETWSYDAQRGWLTADTVATGPASTAPGTVTSATQLGYNTNATVSSTADSSQQTADTFGYDHAQQIQSVTGTDAATTSYDAAGDITAQSTTGSYTYGATPASRALCGPSAPPAQAVTSIGFPSDPFQTTLCYDAAGDRTREQQPFASQVIGWNPAGEASTITTTVPGVTDHSVNSVTSLSYGPDGSLARQTRTTGTGTVTSDSRYYGGLAQLAAGSGLTTIYYFAGRIIATRTGTAVTYVHTDALGSPDTLTGSSGQVTARIHYDPWGQRSVTTGAVPAGLPGYTGATVIAGTDYVQDGARLYDTAHGQFLSADPVTDSSGTTDGLNRYAYVGNDPATLTDPTGYDDYDPSDSADPGDETIDGDPDTNTYPSEVEPIPIDNPPQAASRSAVSAIEDTEYNDADFDPGATEDTINPGTYDFTDDDEEPITATAPPAGTSGLWNQVSDTWNGLSTEEKVGAVVFGGLVIAAATVTLFPTLGLGAAVAISGLVSDATAAVTGGIAAAIGTAVISKPELEEEAAEDAGGLASRVDKLHGALDPIAQNSRTTAVLRTEEGTDILASGGRDLSPAQRALANEGDILARAPGAHAEITALQAAEKTGLTPSEIAVSRPICTACQIYIKNLGGVINDDLLGAYWP